jgi:uncharacterized protein YndB with AHSA1/START domain
MGLTSHFGDEVSLVIPAPPDAVWKVVSDLDGIGDRSPECVGVEWLDGATGPAVGARFRGRNRVGPVRWSTTSTIDVWDPPRRLTYVARFHGAATRWTYELEAVPEGTRVTERFQTCGSNKLILASDNLMRRPAKLRGDMQRTLEAMKQGVDPGTS